MTTSGPTALVAAVQATPVFLDRDDTIDKVGTRAKEVAAAGARLVAFPEGFVPTYPDWVWRTNPWVDGEWYARWSTSASTSAPTRNPPTVGTATYVTGT